MGEDVLFLAQDRLRNLEKGLQEWMQKKIGSEEFAAGAVIELLEMKKLIDKLLVKHLTGQDD